MDEAGTTFWATLSATGPVIGLALVLEARWGQERWNSQWTRPLRVIWAALYVIVAVAVAIATTGALALLARGMDGPRTLFIFVMACGLGMVMISPILGVLADAFKTVHKSTETVSR